MAPLGMQTLDTSEDLLLVSNEGHTHFTQLTEREVGKKGREINKKSSTWHNVHMGLDFFFCILSRFNGYSVPYADVDY